MQGSRLADPHQAPHTHTPSLSLIISQGKDPFDYWDNKSVSFEIQLYFLFCFYNFCSPIFDLSIFI